MRTPPSNAADVLTVKFAIDTSIAGENAVVSVRDGRAEIRGGRFRALVFGAGRLLRAIRYGTRAFALEDGDYPFAPAKPFRQAYLARHFDNWYLTASADELIRSKDSIAAVCERCGWLSENYPKRIFKQQFKQQCFYK